MKYLKIKINADGSTEYFEKHLAYQFEHNSTTLQFEFPEEYINENYFYYPCFRFNSNQEYISRIVTSTGKFDWVVPNFTTQEAGALSMTVIIKDLTNETILTTEAIRLYIGQAEFNSENFNDASTDPNISIWLDDLDKLFIEVRNIDERIAALTNEEGLVEVIDARGGYSSLRLHLESIKSQIIGNQDKINLINTISKITLLTNNWSDTAPFKQTINVTGITENSYPIGSLVRSGADEQKRLQSEEYCYISETKTTVGQIEFICDNDRPTLDLNLILKGK